MYRRPHGNDSILETIIPGTLISARSQSSRVSLPSDLEIPEILVTLTPFILLVVSHWFLGSVVGGSACVERSDWICSHSSLSILSSSSPTRSEHGAIPGPTLPLSVIIVESTLPAFIERLDDTRGSITEKITPMYRLARKFSFRRINSK